jgi:hypothetical protein
MKLKTVLRLIQTNSWHSKKLWICILKHTLLLKKK